MKTLSIDVETYSGTSLPDCGVYKYVEDEDFDILIFGYSVDEGPVQVVDLLCGEEIPQDVFDAIWDPSVEKVAWNCNFERTTIAKKFGRYCPPEQWFDPMIMSACCGLPSSLDAAGEALGIDPDKAKMKVGKQLIREFSMPCKPTKKNGGKTRVFPEDDPENWALYKSYNGRDVEAEMEISRRLRRWRPPLSEHKLWCLDQQINDRGMRVDVQLAKNAIEIGDSYKAKLIEKAQNISGLVNPNSTAQVKMWLQEQEGLTVPSLNKKVIADVVAALPDGAAKEFMELRSEFSKSSTKKYEAIVRSVCSDDHIRGTFQFCGAGRTGRWCLTGDHEVLTTNGWVRIDEWNGGDILCWNPVGEQLAFQTAERVEFPYSGEMIEYNSQRCRQVATPDHKMATMSKSGTWVPRTLSDIGEHRVVIPFTGTGYHRQSLDPDQLRVLIMTQADGHYAECGIVKYKFKKKRKIERCKKLLRRCGVFFVEKDYGDATAITIPARYVPIWLRQFRDKTFGYWLLDESPDVLFDELPEWDGYRCGPNSMQYATCNEQNADVIQACALLAGYSATKLVKADRKENWSDAYYVNIWFTPGRGTIIRKEQMSSIDYSGTVYCATTPTGYFAVRRNGVMWITGNSGRLVQLQNLPQNHMEDLDAARYLVRENDAATLKLLYPDVTSTLSELIRTSLIPEEGQRFIVADYSAIEARVIAWIANEQWRLKVFEEGGDIYCASASQMFKVPVVKHGENGHLRQKGKIAELALGYGGGVNALKAFGADKSMTEEEMVGTVDLWREASPHICALWKSIEKAAIRSVVRKEPAISTVGNILFEYESPILWMTLPSGRRIAYYGMEYSESGRRTGKSLSYMGVNQTTRRWERIETWGGKLTENCVQATARDCLKESMLALNKEGFDIRGTVHDEVIITAPYNRTVEEACEIMGRELPWAKGLPLRADGYECTSYRKD